MVLFFIVLVPLFIFGMIAGATGMPEPFASLFSLLGPVCAVAICLAIDKDQKAKEPQKKAMRDARAAAYAAQAKRQLEERNQINAREATHNTAYSKLSELKQMETDGLITHEEYQIKKEEILRRM